MAMNTLAKVLGFEERGGLLLLLSKGVSSRGRVGTLIWWEDELASLENVIFSLAYMCRDIIYRERERGDWGFSLGSILCVESRVSIDEDRIKGIEIDEEFCDERDDGF